MRTRVKARILIRGGFKSPRGTYSGEHTHEEIFEYDLKMMIENIDRVEAVVRDAERKLKYDEVIISRRVEMAEVE